MLTAWLNQIVVVDTDTRLTYVGTLTEAGAAMLRLRDVGIYDADEARIPLDRFLVECAEFGHHAVRRELLLREPRVVSVTLLRDVVVPGKP